MKIDYDRLLKVASGELTGRRCGKTTLACYSVVGTLDVSNDGDIWCMVKYYKDCEFIIRMLVEILRDSGYNVSNVRLHAHVIELYNGRSIRFVCRDDERVAGTHGWWVDFVDY